MRLNKFNKNVPAALLKYLPLDSSTRCFIMLDTRPFASFCLSREKKETGVDSEASGLRLRSLGIL